MSRDARHPANGFTIHIGRPGYTGPFFSRGPHRNVAAWDARWASKLRIRTRPSDSTPSSSTRLSSWRSPDVTTMAAPPGRPTTMRLIRSSSTQNSSGSAMPDEMHRPSMRLTYRAKRSELAGSALITRRSPGTAAARITLK